MNKNKSSIDRKGFFGKLAKGALGFSLLSFIPNNIFSSFEQVNEKKLVKIKIHPSSVKRNKG